MNFLFALIVLSNIGFCASFTLSNHRQYHHSTRTVKFSFRDENEEVDRDYAMLQNTKRTCILQFLTQRSLQSFMFLLNDLRDPHTSDWIERFLGANRLIEYHGTGAFNQTKFETWDQYFLDMMKLPKERIIVQARGRYSGHGGGSKNNPFIKRDNMVEVAIDIDPQSLVYRMMSVREQISKEFLKDLDVVQLANNQIMTIYEAEVGDKTEVSGETESAFQRNAIFLFVNSVSLEPFKSSPIRQGSYDLLFLLSLHESILRVLRDYKKSGDEKQVSFNWLKDFFYERLDSHFDGPKRYGCADDFMEELLLCAPSLRNADDGRHMELIDPMKIAADIIATRNEVLEDWKQIVGKVPDDHIGLRKSLLTAQSMTWNQDDTDGFNSSEDDDLGSFQ